jgi:ABC-type multidrug transport system permease subunit
MNKNMEKSIDKGERDLFNKFLFNKFILINYLSLIIIPFIFALYYDDWEKLDMTNKFYVYTSISLPILSLLPLLFFGVFFTSFLVLIFKY